MEDAAGSPMRTDGAVPWPTVGRRRRWSDAVRCFGVLPLLDSGGVLEGVGGECERRGGPVAQLAPGAQPAVDGVCAAGGAMDGSLARGAPMGRREPGAYRMSRAGTSPGCAAEAVVIGEDEPKGDRPGGRRDGRGGACEEGGRGGNGGGSSDGGSSSGGVDSPPVGQRAGGEAVGKD